MDNLTKKCMQKNMRSKRDLNMALLGSSRVSYPSYQGDLGLERAVIARIINLILFLFWVKGMRVIQEVDMIQLLGLSISYD